MTDRTDGKILIVVEGGIVHSAFGPDGYEFDVVIIDKDDLEDEGRDFDAEIQQEAAGLIQIY